MVSYTNDLLHNDLLYKLLSHTATAGDMSSLTMPYRLSCWASAHWLPCSYSQSLLIIKFYKKIEKIITALWWLGCRIRDLLGVSVVTLECYSIPKAVPGGCTWGCQLDCIERHGPKGKYRNCWPLFFKNLWTVSKAVTIHLEVSRTTYKIISFCNTVAFRLLKNIVCATMNKTEHQML